MIVTQSIWPEGLFSLDKTFRPYMLHMHTTLYLAQRQHHIYPFCNKMDRQPQHLAWQLKTICQTVPTDTGQYTWVHGSFFDIWNSSKPARWTRLAPDNPSRAIITWARMQYGAMSEVILCDPILCNITKPGHLQLSYLDVTKTSKMHVFGHANCGDFGLEYFHIFPQTRNSFTDFWVSRNIPLYKQNKPTIQMSPSPSSIPANVAVIRTRYLTLFSLQRGMWVPSNGHSFFFSAIQPPASTFWRSRRTMELSYLGMNFPVDNVDTHWLHLYPSIPRMSFRCNNLDMPKNNLVSYITASLLVQKHGHASSTVVLPVISGCPNLPAGHEIAAAFRDNSRLRRAYTNSFINCSTWRPDLPVRKNLSMQLSKFVWPVIVKLP